MVVLFFIIASGAISIAMIIGIDITEPKFILVFQAITQILTFLCPAILFSFFFYDKPGKHLKLDFRRDKWWKALVAMTMLICIIPLSDWLAQINDNWHWSGAFESIEQSLRQMSEGTEELMDRLLTMNGIGDLLLNILVIALIAAVCEEFLFRGVLQQWFGSFMNKHLAIIITAAIFSLIHGEFFSFLPRFMLGIFLGYLFQYSGSILVNISAHFLNNTSVVVVYYLYTHEIIATDITKNIDAAWYVILLGTIIALTLFYIFFLRQNFKKPNKSTE